MGREPSCRVGVGIWVERRQIVFASRAGFQIEVHDQGCITHPPVFPTPRGALTIFLPIWDERMGDRERVKSFFLGPSLERQRGWHDSQFYGPGLEHVQKDALVLRNRKLPKMAFR